MMISKAKLNINIISNKLSSKKDIYIMNITVHYQLSIIHYTLSIVHYTLSIINYQLYIIHYQLYIIHCPLSIVHYEETLQSG